MASVKYKTSKIARMLLKNGASESINRPENVLHIDINMILIIDACI
jgi:hypothetical protein